MTTTTIDAELAEATELSNKEEYNAALTRLKALRSRFPSDARVTGVLGGVLLKMERFDEARQCFQEAASLSPASELASLGLFHCLWVLGERAAAKREAERFMALGSSAEYRLLLEELGWSFDGETGRIEGA